MAAVAVGVGSPLAAAQEATSEPLGELPAEADFEIRECLFEEPADYRQSDFRALTPCTLAGARVLDTLSLKRLVDGSRPPVLVDVMPSPRKPASLGEDALWLPQPRDNIAGSLWLPNTGFGTLPREEEAYLRNALQQLRNTAGDGPMPALVFYCEASCWMSWNAAKRALEWGYGNVYWYPEGTDGWREAGFDLVAAEPEPQA